MKEEQTNKRELDLDDEILEQVSGGAKFASKQAMSAKANENASRRSASRISKR